MIKKLIEFIMNLLFGGKQKHPTELDAKAEELESKFIINSISFLIIRILL
jgi:hypothetical protein